VSGCPPAIEAFKDSDTDDGSAANTVPWVIRTTAAMAPIAPVPVFMRRIVT
jgi:hypothetical protein